MSDDEDHASIGRYDHRAPRSDRAGSPDSRSDRQSRRCPTPSSVKAFASARQRGRLSISSETQGIERRDDARRGSYVAYGASLRSDDARSSRSSRSRPGTVDFDDSESLASLATIRSSDTDISRPARMAQSNHELSINFNVLDALIELEQSERPTPHAFESFQSSGMETNHFPMVTSDGDFMELPPRLSSDSKQAHGMTAAQQQPKPIRFSFFSSAWESTLHAAEFGDLLLPGEDVRNLFHASQETANGVWWLHLNNPTPTEVVAISSAFGIHPLTIEDISTQESREKIELFPSYYFASFRSFHVVEEPEGIEFEPFSMYLVVFREGIITFSFAPETHASKVRFRISQLTEHVSLSSDWICYALISSDDIVDSFLPAITQIEREADKIEDEVFITRPEDHQAFLQRMSRSRANLTGLMRLLGGKVDVLRAFVKRCNENYKVTPRMDIGLYLGDIQDHVVTMINSLVQFETILSRCRSNYLAQLSIDNVTQGNRTNEFLSRITVIASVLVPLNLVCFLFGMNVRVPWGQDDNLNAWLGITSGIILFVLLSLLVAKRLKYI
ncbi:magnesium transporter ALR1 [Verticillium alfalfae VaMs.102]|uniref:Magnesium transporter ALR1 n=1 Tax=Verticillium alfalfae (strain VaMs.102 / ATCC MYA-4576 / FGSC 10136) TaxID=526221 RepID=C9SSG2_VERA1|nr:magnesium transporter ALR1 [Verticillium alfalfae VaMs.102]EEY21727.1 magnesium transporter ALR1 [Verticillium alfalfae VaMs.102]